MSSNILDKGLKKIGDIISEMADLAERTVKTSIEAFMEGGSVEAQVRAWSDALRDMQFDLEEKVVELLARYNPVAGDLRYLKGSMKISYDLSRFGRYAFDISHTVNLLNGYVKSDEEISFIHEMGIKTLDMLRLSREIYTTEDLKLIDKLYVLENEVDEMYKNNLKRMAKNPPKKIEVLITTILLARHLERIADHACYIAEETYYMVTGRTTYLQVS
jgi:phosphate transport system protein